MLYIAPVAPPMFTPFFRHWYVGAGEPLAPTVKLAPDPTHAVCAPGCPVISGVVFTVNTAALLVTLPHGFVTTQS